MRTNGFVTHDQLLPSHRKGQGGVLGWDPISEVRLPCSRALACPLPPLPCFATQPCESQEAAGSLHAGSSNPMSGLQHGLWESRLTLQTSVSSLQGCGKS